MSYGWEQFANCAQIIDADIMFPEQNDSARPAKSVCAKCTVQLECLQDALSRRKQVGVRGGLTPFERKKLLRDAA